MIFMLIIPSIWASTIIGWTCSRFCFPLDYLSVYLFAINLPNVSGMLPGLSCTMISVKDVLWSIFTCPAFAFSFAASEATSMFTLLSSLNYDSILCWLSWVHSIFALIDQHALSSHSAGRIISYGKISPHSSYFYRVHVLSSCLTSIVRWRVGFFWARKE